MLGGQAYGPNVGQPQPRESRQEPKLRRQLPKTHKSFPFAADVQLLELPAEAGDADRESSTGQRYPERQVLQEWHCPHQSIHLKRQQPALVLGRVHAQIDSTESRAYRDRCVTHQETGMSIHLCCCDGCNPEAQAQAGQLAEPPDFCRHRQQGVLARGRRKTVQQAPQLRS